VRLDRGFDGSGNRFGMAGANIVKKTTKKIISFGPNRSAKPVIIIAIKPVPRAKIGAFGTPEKIAIQQHPKIIVDTILLRRRNKIRAKGQINNVATLIPALRRAGPSQLTICRFCFNPIRSKTARLNPALVTFSIINSEKPITPPKIKEFSNEGFLLEFFRTELSIHNSPTRIVAPIVKDILNEAKGVIDDKEVIAPKIGSDIAKE
jgi:hypothetical protein